MLIDCHDIINAIAACGIMFLNAIVSTAQEYRAKRRLERISLLVRPSVTVVRDGEEREIDRLRRASAGFRTGGYTTSGPSPIIRLAQANFFDFDRGSDPSFGKGLS